MTPISTGWVAVHNLENDKYTISSPVGDTIVVDGLSYGSDTAYAEVLRQLAQDLIHCGNPRIKFGVTYVHATKGVCKLIAPDPEDGALLIMERVGDDSVLGEYFSCEGSELYQLGGSMR